MAKLSTSERLEQAEARARRALAHKYAAELPNELVTMETLGVFLDVVRAAIIRTTADKKHAQAIIDAVRVAVEERGIFAPRGQ